MTHQVSYIKERDGGLEIHVLVVPKSSREAILGQYQDRLKIALTAAPEKGKANEALVKFLAKSFGIPKSNISILSGETNKRKTIFLRHFTNSQRVREVAEKGVLASKNS